MNSLGGELKKLIDASGFDAGLADKTGRVLYCPDGMGLNNGDPVSAPDHILLPVQGPDGSSFILFTASNREEKADEISLRALKLLSLGLFGDSEKPNTLTELFEAALEKRPGSKAKRIETLLGPASEKPCFRIIVACTDRGESGREQIDLIKAVASGLFPEEQGFATGAFRYGSSYYAALMFRTGEPGDHKDAEELALTLVDTASADTMLPVKAAVSGAFCDTEKIESAAAQAIDVLNLADSFGILDKCLVYEKLGLERMIASLKPEELTDYLRSTLGSKFSAEKSYAELLSTVNVFLQSNNNSSVAAKRMDVHRNTVNNRLEKFQKLTGLDCSSSEDAARVKIALLIIRYLESGDMKYGR